MSTPNTNISGAAPAAPAASSVDNHIALQLEQQKKQIQAERAENERLMRELEMHQQKSKQYDTIMAETSKKRSQEVLDLVNTAKKVAIEMLEESDPNNDPMVNEYLQTAKAVHVGASPPAAGSEQQQTTTTDNTNSNNNNNNNGIPQQQSESLAVDFSNPDVVSLQTNDFLNTMKAMQTLVFANSAFRRKFRSASQPAAAAAAPPTSSTNASGMVSAAAAGAIPGLSPSSLPSASSSTSSFSSSSSSSSTSSATGAPQYAGVPAPTTAPLKYAPNPVLFQNLGTKPKSDVLYL